MAVLSGDVLLIILDFLKEDASNHNTLFHCALVSRWFAEPSLSILYQSYDSSPVFGGGTEDMTFTRDDFDTSGSSPVLKSSLKIVQTFSKWLLMWKSIILSTSEGKTYLPYCHYIRYLDLDDFRELLMHPNFTGSVRDDFYYSGIGDIVYQGYESRGLKRLRSAKDLRNSSWVVERVGTVIIEKAPMIRELRGTMSGTALKQWVAHMPNLRTLDLWTGASFSEKADESIREHCPDFKNLSVFRWADTGDSTADAEAERVLNNLRPDTLETFETISSSSLGPRSVLALGRHLNSLKKLTVTRLSVEGIAQLSSIAAPKALRTLTLTDSTLELGDSFSDEAISTMVSWICQCESLRHLHLRNFFLFRDEVILSRILVDERVHLETLNVSTFIAQDAQDFQHALPFQAASLRSLSLEGELGGVSPSQENLVQAICQLSELRELDLKSNSHQPLEPENIVTMAQHLTKLERVIITGTEVYDFLWPAFQTLTNLRFLSIHGECDVSVGAIIEFASMLSPTTNRGFHLSISGGTRTYIPTDQQKIISDFLEQNVGGTFDYTVVDDDTTSPGSFVSDREL